MALPSTPDISYKRNNEIFNFIIQCVKDEDSDNEGVRGKRLRELYLDRYLDKDRQHHEEYVTREKIFVIDIIKSMIQVG